MAKKNAVSARRKTAAADNLPQATVVRRVGWVALAGVWLFLFVALISFDAADFPSHSVAAHNEPAANLCGKVGAMIAYGAFNVIGAGAWVFMAALVAFLGVTVTGRFISHPLVRAVGVVLIALAVSCLHALLLPTLGSLSGAPAGLVGETIVNELAPRFSTVGSLLLILAALGVGAIVAFDRLVFAAPRAAWSALHSVRHVKKLQVLDLRNLKLRPERAGKESKKSKRTSRRPLDAPIDPDAGGIGGVDAFDPDEEVLEDDADEEWEYEDDDEYEYEDEYEDDEEEDAEEEEPQRLTAEQLREKIAKLPLRMGSKVQNVARDEDIPREENFEGYQFPTLDLLSDPESNFSETMEALVRKQAEQLEEALHTYGIDADVVGIESGPTVTLYAVQLAPGTKVSKVSAVSSDIARALKAQNIRIVANIAGKTSIGIEVPNLKKEKVRLKELMSGGQSDGMKLPMFLGKDAAGEPLVADLTGMPHMLIAGTTGSGKSVCMNTIIMSWLYTKRPDELKLVLVDPKMVELSQFSDIPHLMCPVVTEMARAAAILEWAVNKMEERYELLKEARVRDVEGYNALSEEELYEVFEPSNDEERARIPKKLPFIVFVIDELADLMLTNKEVEQSIVRIAQKARAVGIHLILATQRPQANVVTGLIKSNMPCRVSFKVASGMDSRIVLDNKGAELLLGQGDMMFLSPHSSEIIRSQGTLVGDTEIRKVTKFLKDVAGPTFERSLLAIRTAADGGGDATTGADLDERDPLFDDAVEIMIESGRGSVSLLQRRLAIGYSRASRLVDQMGLAGILGEHKGSVARDVMITMEDWQRMKQLEQGGGEEEDLGLMSDEDGYDDESPEIETIGRGKTPVS